MAGGRVETAPAAHTKAHTESLQQSAVARSDSVGTGVSADKCSGQSLWALDEADVAAISPADTCCMCICVLAAAKLIPLNTRATQSNTRISRL